MGPSLQAGVILCLLGSVGTPASAPFSLLPYSRVDTNTDHVLFYLVKDGYQFLFLCRVSSRHVIALEIDRMAEREEEDDGEEAEIIHHLPISCVKGKIQYLQLDRLPESPVIMNHLIQAPIRTLKQLGSDLTVTKRSPGHVMALAAELR